MIVHFIYEFVKFTAKTCIRVFYRPITVIDVEKHAVDNAAIMVTNHPNTLLDPFTTGVWIKRQIFFLANSGMFASKLGNFFFSNVHTIPIQRKSDKHSIDNKDSFKAANKFLSDGGLLWVAMEGGSDVGRHLRPLKSGTARIAMDAEVTNNWELDLLILPTGLTYDKADYFQSRYTVVYGDPIRVSDYRAAYEENPQRTFKQLTTDIRERILTLMIHTEDVEQDELLQQIETLHRSEKPLAGKADFYRSKALNQELQRMRAAEPLQYDVVQLMLNQYFTEIESRQLNDQAVVNDRKNNSTWSKILSLIIGLPVFLYGLINNLFSALIPLLVLKKTDLHPSYNTTIKVIIGLITFPLFWIIQAVLISHFTGSSIIALIYLLTLYPLSKLAWKYFVLAKQTIRNRRFKNLNAIQKKAIIENRASVWTLVKELIVAETQSTVT